MLVPYSLLIALAIGAAITDLLEHRIYNRATFPALLAGLVLQTASGTWWNGLGGAAILAVPFFGLFALGKMAAGDVKLLAAIGALGGVPVAIGVGVLSVILGGFVALVTLLIRGRLGDVLMVGRVPGGSLQMPFGVSIAVASLIVVGVVSSGGMG